MLERRVDACFAVEVLDEDAAFLRRSLEERELDRFGAAFFAEDFFAGDFFVEAFLVDDFADAAFFVDDFFVEDFFAEDFFVEADFFEDDAFFEDDFFAGAFFEAVVVRALARFVEVRPFFDEDARFFDDDAFRRLTNLLNRFPSSSESNSARRSRSNHSKNSSQSTSSSVSSPLNPGKSMRRIPGSLRDPVRFTRAGCPPRDSTHSRISPWSVVALDVAMLCERAQALPEFLQSMHAQ